VSTARCDRFTKASIINGWPLNTWEQIEDDILKQWNIVLQELGYIDISESSKQELLLVGVWVICFQ
jgi:hypothetical protein